MSDLFSFGTWVRRRRKTLDLTQAALADRVGCAGVTIRKLEGDAFRPSREMAERLADCLDISPDERTLFLQVARGERGVDNLPTPTAQIDLTSQSVIPRQQPVASIPIDTIPHPAPLPLGSRMPLSRNPLFVGRESDLRQLAVALHARGTAAIGQLEIAAATGLGGIGKTQLACEFVHRYGQFFPGGVFWLSFAQPAAVPAEVAACGGSEGMALSPAFSTLPLDEQVRHVLTAWESPIPRLLMFDNCEDEAVLDQWRPKHGGCRVLVTSRRHHWDPALGVHVVPLDVLPRTESLALLHAFRPDLPLDDPDLGAIAEALGDLPLALHLAGSFLAKYRHALTPTQYQERFHTPTILDDRSLQEAGISPTRHVQHVARTFEQSYERLDPGDRIDALARTLLAHAACFAPGESLPRWLLVATLESLDLRDEAALEPDLLTQDALTRLIDLGLLQTDDLGNLRLHRLLVAFGQAVLVQDAAQASVEVTMVRIANDLNNTRNPRSLLALQPHLHFITEAAQVHANARTASLYNALGYHVRLLGGYAEAQHYLEQGLAIRQRALGIDHPDTAMSIHNIGMVLWLQSQHHEAQHYFEQALLIRQRVLGIDHPDTAMSCANLGVSLWSQGQYVAAQTYNEQALATRRRVLGPDHPDIALNLNTLGVVLKDQGYYAAAQGSYQEALAIQQRVLGPDHPHTAMSLANLGVLLKDQGQYAAAQEYLEQALAVQKQVLGLDHPDTAMSCANLGVTFWLQGMYVAAQEYLEQALVVQKQVLGRDHLYTVASLHHLGNVLCAQGQYAEAQRYLHEALTIRGKRITADHPDIARSLYGLGKLLYTQGELAQARCYFEQALMIFEQRLGPQHPDTEQTHQTIATLDATHNIID